MAILGRKRDWVRLQGRTNAALVLVARDMEAEFVEPAAETQFGSVRGRVQGCTFELKVAPEPEDAYALMCTVRHFHAQGTARFEAPGLFPPELEPAAIKNAIELACYDFSTRH